MDAGLRVRTKQFIQFGLKISFIPCLPTLEYTKLHHINSCIQTIIQLNAEVNETKHSCQETGLVKNQAH